MKKNKVLILTILAFMFLGIVGISLAHPTRILDYTGGTHSGCHGSSDAASSGTFTVSTSTSGRLITLTASIQGFNEALESNNNRSGTFSIGIPYELGDNREFGLGISQNTVNGETAYWGVGIWEVELDTNGNTVNPLRFRVLAPDTDGSYQLFVAVVNGANSTADEQSIIYYHKTLTVIVTSGSVTIASLTSIIPFNSVFLYIACGIVASGAIIILIRRRRN
ncbi:MAG: hypothetical protein ACFE8B_01085 [Candidatus Hermodarchaeota archaeon]